MSWNMNDTDNRFPLIILLVGTLSILLSFVVILIYTLNKNLRTFTSKMIASICFSDILFTFGIICNESYVDLNNRFICNMSAFLTLFGSLSSLSWGCIISYTVYLNTVSLGSKETIKKTKHLARKNALIFSYITPFICAVIPLFFEDYQNVGDVCYITLTSTSGYVWNIGLSLIPLMMEIIFIFVFIFKSLRAQQKEYQQSSKQLLLYPTICLVAFGSFFCQKSYELITGLSCGCDYDWHSISFILCAMNGGLNAVCYGFNSSICLPLLSCCQKPTSSINTDHGNSLYSVLRADQIKTQKIQNSQDSNIFNKHDYQITIQKQQVQNNSITSEQHYNTFNKKTYSITIQDSIRQSDSESKDSQS